MPRDDSKRWVGEGRKEGNAERGRTWTAETCMGGMTEAGRQALQLLPGAVSSPAPSLSHNQLP